MTLDEMIAELTEARTAFGRGDVEVRIAYQPNYPIAAYVSTVTLDATNCDRSLLWIAAGSSPDDDPYAPRHAWYGGEVSGDEDDDRRGELR